MSSDMDPHEVADNVFAFTGTEVNWVIVRAGTDLTLIDAGWEGDTQEVERSIRSLGRRPEDLRAVLLTHAHADHTGALNHLHDNYGVPIYMDQIEVANARGENVETGGPLDVAKLLYRPQAVRWASQVVKAGALHHISTPGAAAFPRAGALDLPGRPFPVPTPGHTSGHTSYLLPDVGGGGDRGRAGQRSPHPERAGTPAAARRFQPRPEQRHRLTAHVAGDRSGNVRPRSRAGLVRPAPAISGPGL